MQLQRFLQHLGLLTANDDAARLHALQAVPRCGQRDDDLARDLVEHILRIVDDTALQGTQQVENGNVAHLRMLNGLHVAFGNVPSGDHAVEVSAFVRHGNGGHGHILQHFPRMAHWHRRSDQRRAVIVQVMHLGAHRAQEDRRLKAELIQQKRRFVIEMAQPRRHILLIAQGIAQRRIGHGGNHRIGVGVAMSKYINRIHKNIPFV